MKPGILPVIVLLPLCSTGPTLAADIGVVGGTGIANRQRATIQTISVNRPIASITAMV